MAPTIVATGPNGVSKEETEPFDPKNLLLQEPDLFLSSLDSEAYLDSLAPIITEALKANALAEFISKLNDYVKEKDEALNQKSLDSANDINTCIDTIDEVSHQSHELSGSLLNVNRVLKQSTLGLIEIKSRYLKAKDTERAINETSLVLNLCIQVLEITNKAHKLIKQRRYFSALKLIDELTSIHLPKVNNFSFSVKIYDSIPHLTAMIKDEAFDNFCKWLSTQIERKIDDIGNKVCLNLNALQKAWAAMREELPVLLPHRLNSAVEISMRDADLNLNIFESADLNITLGPVFDCVLVYQSLGELPNLCATYNKEWMKKYQRVIYPMMLALNTHEKLAFFKEPSVSFPDLPSLETYLRKTAALFVVDKQLNAQTKFELRKNSSADDLWDSFANKLKPVLLSFLEKQKWTMENIQTLEDFKDVLGNFIQTMENLQYKISELYDILIIVLRDYYGPLLIQQFRLDFIDSIQSDHYMPSVVTNESMYDDIMRICWYKSDSSFAPKSVKGFPVSFPFSEDYLRYCINIRQLLKDLIDFTSEYYSQDLAELNRIIVNDIFERCLGDTPGVGICHDLKVFITKNSNNKEIVAQSYTNLEYYLYSLYEIGKLIDRKLRVCNGIGIINIDTNSTFKLKAIEIFASVRKFSEDAIFKMVDQKVHELLDLLQCEDWEPAKVNDGPSGDIEEFAMFLENLFNSIFSNLPSSFRTLGLFRSFDFISEYFLNELLNAPRFNRYAIMNLDLDIKHLEESMASLVAKESSDAQGGGALQSTFTELRQSIDLLLLDSYDEYIKDPAFRMRCFDRLKYESAVKLLQKMQRDEDDGSDILSVAETQLTREASILSGSAANFANWSKFRKNDA